MHLLQICHACEHCQPPPHNGPVACTVDGVDIIAHFKTRTCPKGKFEGVKVEDPPPPPPPPTPAPPEVLSARWALCFPCVHNLGLREVLLPGKPLAVLVKCEKCTKCGNAKSLSNAADSCPIGNWSAANE